MALRPGTRLGRFVVLGPLGEGGMGTVHEARDEETGERVALKVVPATNVEVLERFEREARLLQSVALPNVVGFRDVGKLEGALWIALELMPGGSLQGRLDRGRLPWREAVSIGAVVARALDALHARGIVHRDVKPANILIGADGKPRLSDLGLARLWSGTALTESGVAIGTLPFSSPEQLAGQRDVDGRADVYSLGATLHALIAGSPPFSGGVLALMKQHAHERPPPLRSLVPGVPVKLEQLLLRLLDKERGRRGDAIQAARDLEAIAREGPSRASRGLLVAAALFAVAASALLAGVWRARPAAKDPPPPPPQPPRARILERVIELVESGKAVDAASEAHRAVALEPRSARAHAALARALLGTRELRSAVDEATKAIELDRSDAAIWGIRAAVRDETGDTASALEDAEHALALDHNEFLAREVRGFARMKRGERRGALEDLERASRLRPGNPGVHHMLVELHLGFGELAAAEAEATKLIEIRRFDAHAWAIRADVRRRAGDNEGARNDLDEAIARDSKETISLIMRANVRLAKQDVDGALADAEAAVESDASFAQAWLVRSEARVAKGRVDSALSDAERGMELNPALPDSWRVRAIARLGMGDVVRGKADAERFLEMAPRDANAPTVRKLFGIKDPRD